MATDGETVYMIADLYPSGIGINTAPYQPQPGSTGYNENGQLILAKETETISGASSSADRLTQPFNYFLEKIPGASERAHAYYQLKEIVTAENGETTVRNVDGYTIDAYFNIKGERLDTNLFYSNSPYYPWPTDFLYMTKSTDGGDTWSAPTLIDIKETAEQTLLVGPGRGHVIKEGSYAGRIIFTAYEWTGGDIASCAFYSDDKGKSWVRGEDVSEQSSEAVITEANGDLYMFTRHGGYYVSENGGESWSSQKM